MSLRYIAFVAAFFAVCLFASSAFAQPEQPTESETVPAASTQKSKVDLLNPEYNPIPDQDLEVKFNVGLIGGSHIGTHYDTGFRGTAEGIFSLDPTIGLYGLLGGSVSGINGRTSIGADIGVGVYGFNGFDTGLLVDWFLPEGSVNLYQLRAFFQTGVSPTDRIGVRFTIPLGKDTYNGGPFMVDWNFELVSWGGAFWQHSWFDELATEFGLYWAGGDVDEIIMSATLLYYYNERMNFRFTTTGDFSGDDIDLGIYLEVKVGPGSVRKPAYDYLRFFNGGVASYGPCILNIPYNKYAPAWDGAKYWE